MYHNGPVKFLTSSPYPQDETRLQVLKEERKGKGAGSDGGLNQSSIKGPSQRTPFLPPALPLNPQIAPIGDLYLKKKKKIGDSVVGYSRFGT